MILAIDIGNTTTTLAILDRGRVKKSWSLRTAGASFVLRKGLHRLIPAIKKYSKQLQGIVICSVVPKATALVQSSLYNTTGIKPRIVGRDLKVPIKNLYRKPLQVGQDRLVCAFAAKELHGAPAIVVDFGTAITFDAISKKGDYLGGAIVPGLRLYAESLFEKTALLPKVKITKPGGVIGTDTKESILSGIFYGYGSLCDGMIRLISKRLKQTPIVIATGGYASIVKKFIKKINIVDRDLIFKGLFLIQQKNLSKVKGRNLPR